MELFLCLGCNRSTGCLLLRTPSRLRFQKRCVWRECWEDSSCLLLGSGLQEITTCTGKGGAWFFFSCIPVGRWLPVPNGPRMSTKKICTMLDTAEASGSTREIRQGPHGVHLCLSVFRKLETWGSPVHSILSTFPISIAISRQWRPPIRPHGLGLGCVRNLAVWMPSAMLKLSCPNHSPVLMVAIIDYAFR